MADLSNSFDPLEGQEQEELHVSRLRECINRVKTDIESACRYTSKWKTLDAAQVDFLLHGALRKIEDFLSLEDGE